jgi:hypothetical protein
MAQLISGITIGIILFHTGANAPTIFKTLETEPAGKLLRGLFPKFFKWLAGLGVLTAAAAAYSSRTEVAPFVIAGLTVVLPLVCLSIIPATNRAKDAGNSASFKRLHTVSVLLTLVVLAANMAMPFVQD